MGLYKKFILCFTAVALLTIVFFSWQNFRISQEQIRDNRRGKIELLNEIINNGLKSLMLEGRGREFQKFLENLIAEDIVAIRIFTADGIILNSTVPGEIGQRFQHKDLSAVRTRSEQSLFSLDEEKGRKVFSKIVLIRNDRLCQRCHGGGAHIRGMLDVEFASKGTEQAIAAAAGGVTRVALITLFLLFGAAWLLGRYLIKKPLGELIGSVEQIAGGAQGSQLPIPRGSKELGRLVSTLNAIMADIDRKRAEIDQCRADRDAYVEKMASLGELAATVAHDIKNPLAGISGALQVLAEDFPEDSPRKDIAGEILSEIDRLDGAVKDLLLFARPPDMHLIPVDINAIIEKVMARVAPRIEEQKCRMELKSTEVPAVLADPEQMGRAIGNIALHSLQSMPCGGLLEFAVQGGPEPDQVEITVSDTGPGLPGDKLKDIFKPFFSSKHSGSGLGLAITRNIVEGHRGRIEVESSPGQGTRYRIILLSIR